MSPRDSDCTFIFFFNDTATTEIYTLSLHDALPICVVLAVPAAVLAARAVDLQNSQIPRPQEAREPGPVAARALDPRSEEHTSELQSRQYLVCRLLLEKKKPTKPSPPTPYLRHSTSD